MSDIFISYSRKDSEQAIELAERLRASGIGVWIDQQGIEAATSWSQEIVDEIDNCTVFLLLLSEHSVSSINVVREVSIAFESERPILPVDLESVSLPLSMRYQLAGIQRTRVADFDGIMRALGRLGAVTVSTLRVTDGAVGGYSNASSAQGQPTMPLRKQEGEPDRRKSLIVLPFEDMSPGGDNAWFADGLTGELIDALGHIKSLRLTDRKTSMGFKGYSGKTKDIAREYNIRYFIEGSVRKFGDQIKISVSLLDIRIGEYIWQESHRGVFADIFEIQESVAQKVVEGLKLHLSDEEEQKVSDHGTENAEAYQLYIKGMEYFGRQTKEGYQLAIQVLGDALLLDPDYANAHKTKANALAALYRTYDRDPNYLAEAEAHIAQALRIKPDFWDAYQPLSHIYQLQGKLEAAEQTAEAYIEHAPDEPMAYFALGFFYFNTGQAAKAIAPYEELFRRSPTYLAGAWNLIVACDAADERGKCARYAAEALPYFERHLKLHPDDESMRVSRALLLHDAGRLEESREAARALVDVKDATSLFNVACLCASLGDMETSFKTIRCAIELGYRSRQSLKDWLEQDDMLTYKGTPEYEQVRELIEKLVAE